MKEWQVGSLPMGGRNEGVCNYGKEKKTISTGRFQKGIDKVSNNEITKDEFLNMLVAYDLSDTQKAAIKLL